MEEKLRFIRNSAVKGWCVIMSTDLTEVMRTLKEQREALHQLIIDAEDSGNQLRVSQASINKAKKSLGVSPFNTLPKGVIAP